MYFLLLDGLKCFIRILKNIAIMTVSLLNMIPSVNWRTWKHSVHEDRSRRVGSISSLMKMWHVICVLTDVVQVYTMTTWSVTWYMSWFIVCTRGCIHPQRMMTHFNCYQIVKNVSTTEVRPGTCGQVRSFWDRRLDEILCGLIFKVSCSLVPYVVKIRFDIRILLMSRENTRSGPQPRIRYSRYEYVRQQKISRQIHHEAVRVEFSYDTTLSMSTSEMLFFRIDR